MVDAITLREDRLIELEDRIEQLEKDNNALKAVAVAIGAVPTAGIIIRLGQATQGWQRGTLPPPSGQPWNFPFTDVTGLLNWLYQQGILTYTQWINALSQDAQTLGQIAARVGGQLTGTVGLTIQQVDAEINSLTAGIVQPLNASINALNGAIGSLNGVIGSIPGIGGSLPKLPLLPTLGPAAPPPVPPGFLAGPFPTQAQAQAAGGPATIAVQGTDGNWYVISNPAGRGPS